MESPLQSPSHLSPLISAKKQTWAEQTQTLIHLTTYQQSKIFSILTTTNCFLVGTRQYLDVQKILNLQNIFHI